MPEWRSSNATGGLEAAPPRARGPPPPRRSPQRFVAARARVPRAPWQTSEEFMLATLARLALPRPAVERLTRLFELARFSHHALGHGERDSARTCLEEIRTALESGEASLVIA